MGRYVFQWITEQLAAGPAPMSIDDLDTIQGSGITGIVNLGGEISELSDIERQSGFEVFFLPVEDGGTPDAIELEEALEWLDESLYLGRKVLVHCRHGMGRTGTFVTTYLIRRGFGLKLAGKTIKHVRSVPTSYLQWRLLRKYDGATLPLKARRPDLRSRKTMNLEPFFADYKRIADGVCDSEIACGREHDECCHESFSLSLAEAAWLHHATGTLLDQPARRGIAERLRKKDDAYICALNIDRQCILFSHRPIRCMCSGSPMAATSPAGIEERLHILSRQLFVALTGTLSEDATLSYPMSRVLSGAYVQDYFADAIRVSGLSRNPGEKAGTDHSDKH